MRYHLYSMKPKRWQLALISLLLLVSMAISILPIPQLSGVASAATTIDNFTYKKQLWLNTSATGANVVSAQANFPICVHINTSSWSNQADRDAFFDTNTLGKRIQFFDSDETTNLDYEVEHFSNVQGSEEAIYWARVPSVAGNSTTDSIWVAYGNDPNESDQDNPTGVWDANFMGVWHSHDASTTTIADSANAHTGTKLGVGAPVAIAAKVYNGQNYDGVDDYINVPDHADLDLTTGITISSWAKHDVTASEFLVSKYISGSDAAYYLSVDASNRPILGFFASDAGKVNTGVTAMGTAALRYVAGTYSTADGIIRVYLDDALDADDAILGSPSIDVTIDAVRIGWGYSDTYAWDGILDEVRISQIARTADWLKLEYYSMKKTNWNGDSWLSWGSQIGSTPTVVTSDPSSLGRTTATANGDITDIGGSNVTIRGFKYGLTEADTWDAHEHGNWSSPGTYSLPISELSPGTIYHIRAYATNEEGTAYGSWVAFVTAPSGLLSGWPYLKQIIIAGQPGASANYQVRLLIGETSGASGENFDLGNHSIDFPNDIRFTDNNGTTLLDHWLESTSGATPNRLATFWIEVADDLSSDQSICVYYGKSGASSESNGVDTFLKFDDFSLSLATQNHQPDIDIDGLWFSASTFVSHAYYDSTGNTTYIAYMDNDVSVGYPTYSYAGIWVIAWNHTTGTRKMQRIGRNTVDGSHGWVTVTMDTSGYLWFFQGPHLETCKVWKSDNTRDITAWTEKTSLPGLNTWVQAFPISTGILVLARRVGTWTHDTWQYKTTDGSSWTSTQLTQFWDTADEGNADNRGYGFGKLEGGVLRVTVWPQQYTPEPLRGLGVGYMETPDEGVTWQAADGTDYSLPVTLATLDWVDETDYCYTLSAPSVLPNGQQVVTYKIAPAEGNATLYTARWDTDEWVKVAIDDTVTNGSYDGKQLNIRVTDNNTVDLYDTRNHHTLGSWGKWSTTDFLGASPSWVDSELGTDSSAVDTNGIVGLILNGVDPFIIYNQGNTTEITAIHTYPTDITSPVPHTGEWTESPGAYATTKIGVNDGVLNIGDSGVAKASSLAATINYAAVALRSKFKYATDDFNGTLTLRNTGQTIRFGTSIWDAYGADRIYGVFLYSAANHYSSNYIAGTPGTYHITDVMVNQDYQAIKIDDTAMADLTPQSTPGNMVTLVLYAYSPMALGVDWVFLRNYVTNATGTEPAFSSAGGEESIGISNTPPSHDFGLVQPSQTIYGVTGLTPPGWPLADGNCTGNVTNLSSFSVDIYYKMGNMTGGIQWTIGATPASNVFTMKICISGAAGIGNCTVLSGIPQMLIEELLADASEFWEFVFYTPTNTPQFDDGTTKTGNITLEAEAH